MVAINEVLQRELEEVMQAAHRASADVGAQVEAVLREGLDHPLSKEETVALLTQVLTTLKQGVERRGDERGKEALSSDVAALVEKVVAVRERVATPNKPTGFALAPYNGLEPGPVRPRPIFHTRPVPMRSGFVKLTDLKLWDENVRLDIHLAQFQQKHGRRPTQEELLDIMIQGANLPGTAEDQFEIVSLARSIAANGVQKPPILDYDGTLLDGNRRVTACHYIRHSDEFGPEAKKRVEYLYVWQLTEDATPDDREAVVVALNFESACKVEWPEYIKARKVYEEWQSIVVLEPLAPGPKRQAEMKRELSRKFALGPDTTVVNRYLKMIEWANDFEEHHINGRGRDEYEVKHASNKYFQYFDEMAKGAKPGGVAHTLNQDDNYKHLVFDLLFEGKIKNWALIRKLKYLDEDVRQGLLGALAIDAHNEDELESIQEKVEQTLDAANARNAEVRQVGANARIESFVKFLEDLPVKAFRDQVTPLNLRRLLGSLELVQGHAKAILADGGGEGAAQG